MWTRDQFRARLEPPCIGMIHLAALPGAPAFAGSLEGVVEKAVADLRALIAGGVGGVMIENFNDVPFHPGSVPPETVAAMAVIADRLRQVAPEIRLGINVLRNDAQAALGLAAAVDASFVRINVHTGAMVTDQGPLVGQAHHTLRRRRELGLDHVGIFADLRVKHAAPLAVRALIDEAVDLRGRGLADVLVVSGVATGAPADPEEIRPLRAALGDCPLVLGSGATVENWTAYADLVDGAIVGTSLKKDGRVAADRVRAMVAVMDRGKDPA